MPETKYHVNQQRLHQLLEEMVNIYSPTGKEGEITEFLAGYLYDKGLPVTMREVTEGRRNIEIMYPDSATEVAFMGHIDTVSAFDIENYRFEEENGQIFGLGTADMKGGCAAMIEAFVTLVENDARPERAGLFLVVGEEETGDGTSAILEAMSFPWALVAEPTDLVPCFAHYGYMEMLVQVFGTRRHAAMAAREYNAIFSMLRMLLRMGALLEADYPEVVMNIRDLHSSEAGFGVPESCEAWVDMHISPAAGPDAFARELEKLISDSFAAHAINKFDVSFPTRAKGYRLDQAGLLYDLLFEAYNELETEWLPGAFKSHSDANLLIEADCKPVILGPGRLSKAHTREESVVFEQVVKAADIYTELLSRLTKKG